MAKSIKVVERKLGREKAVGLAYQDDNEVHIDPRQSAKERMDTEIHEGLHLIFKKMKEEDIAMASRKLTRYMWRLEYRKVNNR